MKKLLKVLLSAIAIGMVMFLIVSYVTFKKQLPPEDIVQIPTPTRVETREEKYKRICPVFYISEYGSSDEAKDQFASPGTQVHEGFAYGVLCNENPAAGEEVGDIVHVTISTTTLEEGKKKFYDWFATTGFTEGPGLKIEFRHDPGYKPRH